MIALHQSEQIIYEWLASLRVEDNIFEPQSLAGAAVNFLYFTV